MTLDAVCNSKDYLPIFDDPVGLLAEDFGVLDAPIETID